MDQKDRLQQLKEEYQCVQAPPAGYDLLKETIARAQRNKRKKAPMTTFRNWSVSAAAVLLIAALLPNINGNMAYAMGNIPVLGAFFRVVTVREYQYDDGKRSADVQVPMIVAGDTDAGATQEYAAVQDEPEVAVGAMKAESDASELYRDRISGSAKAVTQVNEYVDAYINELLGLFETEMNDSGEGYYNLDVSYEVLVDDGSWFTLVIYAVETQASGYEFRKYYNINETTDEVMELSDLFSPGIDYVNIISEEIRQQMKDANANNGTDYFAEDDEYTQGFDRIMADQNYYLNESGDIVIVFDEYEVAPGSYGCPEFTVSWDLVE